MSDNFGSDQSRVLTVSDRSFDQVVFQDRRPPLTSEWNLINQISDFKTQQSIKVDQPSGWVKVGDIKDSGAASTSDTTSEQNAEEKSASGEALTSLTYGSRIFKLICRDETNVAVVNGWPIIVQNGSNTTITLTLPPSSGVYRYDIVFLEVWRKLVSYDESIFPYGNVDATPFSDNEILWDAIGSETTKRVQIQYRIRTYPSESYGSLLDPYTYPEGLGWSNVRPVGGNPDGQYVTISGYHFQNAGPKDQGLYIAGDGSSAAKTALNTVDGYVYAVPMFLVYRRASGISFGPTAVHSSNITWSDANSGYPSDRPDGLYSDAVYDSDIVDVRHQLVTSGKDLDSIVDKSFRRLALGELKTTIGRGFTTNNALLECSGGKELLKVEQLNGSSSTIPNIGNGVSTGFKRRAYINAELISNHNIIEVPIVPINGATWQEGTISISSMLDTSLGVVTSIDGFYSPDDWNDLTGISATNSTITISDSGANSIVGTSKTVYMEFTFKYSADSSGFYDVPDNFLEVSKYLYQPIATRDSTVPVRYDSSQQILTSASSDYVEYKGANYTDNYEFGHDLIYHTTTADGTSITVNAPSGKLSNYYIWGVKSVRVQSGGSYGNPVSFSATVTSGFTSYAITLSSPVTAGSNVQVTLITGSGSTGSGSTDSTNMKYFELSKQGRGIKDIYETVKLSGTRISANTYEIDSVDKPIIALATYAYTGSGGYTEARVFGYDVSSPKNRINLEITQGTDINKYLPVLSSSDYSDNLQPTRLKVIDSSGTDPSSIEVIAIVHSYVPSTESPYNFYYKFSPYQGLLQSGEVRGKIEKEGPAIISSLGSGKINDFSFSSGTVSVSQNSRVVVRLSGDTWKYAVESGDFFSVSGSNYMYRVLYVGTDASNTQGDTRITLAEPFKESSITSSSYSVIRLDVSNDNISNVIERMPSYSHDDYLGRSEVVTIGGVSGGIISSLNRVRLQDPLDTIKNDFKLGDNKESGNRGRSKFVLTKGENDGIKIGELTPYIKYGSDSTWTSAKGNKKVYQSYLFNKSYYDSSYGTYRDLTGRLYLLVVSSESDNNESDILLSPFSQKDTVDIFELIGRPVIRTT